MIIFQALTFDSCHLLSIKILLLHPRHCFPFYNCCVRLTVTVVNTVIVLEKRIMESSGNGVWATDIVEAGLKRMTKDVSL